MTVFNPNSGVTGHSTPDHWQPFVIFAVDDNKAFQAEFPDVTQLQGSYKGETETSYIVTSKEFGKLDPETFHHLDGQESVLYISEPEKRSRGWREAILIYSDGTPSANIGWFKQVPKRIALERDAWTHNPNNGQYWIAETREKEYGHG